MLTWLPGDAPELAVLRRSAGANSSSGGSAYSAFVLAAWPRRLTSLSVIRQAPASHSPTRRDLRGSPVVGLAVLAAPERDVVCDGARAGSGICGAYQRYCH